MLVFAFDRDWTVDVNPHPNHDAVPLSWVHKLAHETPHAVYAIGNQALADEAAIPGVVDIVGRHPDDWDQWLGTKQPDGRYQNFPLRRERLALIADLHPDADEYIVVDDLDLSDVAGWTHYHAWEFVPAVRQGDIDPALPWARDAVSDGGVPTTAGIIPADESMLSSFLADHSNAPAYNLTYNEDGSERDCLLWDVSVDAVPADEPAILCTPLEPRAEQFIVPFERIELLSVVDPPADIYTDHAVTPREEAIALRRLAAGKPEAVRVSSLLMLLDSDESDHIREENALQALALVAEARPDDCTPAVPILRSLLARDAFHAAPDVLATAHSIAEHSPADIAPLVDEIVPYLDSSDPMSQRTAINCLAAVAREDPGAVADAGRKLATIAADESTSRDVALVALARIVQHDPKAADGLAEPLCDAAVDATLSDSVRIHVTAALGGIVSVRPDVVVETVPEFVGLFEVDNYKLRNNAIGIVCDVAMVHTDVVKPYVDEIAALLAVDDVNTRINTTAALSRIATDFPNAVDHLTPTFIDLLSDDEARVRENACWGLGYLGTAEATTVLETRAQDDPDQDVRTRAEWALTQINS